MFGRYNQNGTSSYVEDSLQNENWEGVSLLKIFNFTHIWGHYQNLYFVMLPLFL